MHHYEAVSVQQETDGQFVLSFKNTITDQIVQVRINAQPGSAGPLRIDAVAEGVTELLKQSGDATTGWPHEETETTWPIAYPRPVPEWHVNPVSWDNVEQDNSEASAAPYQFHYRGLPSGYYVQLDLPRFGFMESSHHELHREGAEQVAHRIGHVVMRGLSQ
jgi:hypothetical protein